jgi:DNA adenine methylase
MKLELNYPKPFLKWTGGKTQLINEISGLLPAHIKNGEPFTFIEPFVGTGAMFFWMLRSFSNLQKVVINDVNSELIISYKQQGTFPNRLLGN